jgi:hypothetical protein
MKKKEEEENSMSNYYKPFKLSEEVYEDNGVSYKTFYDDEKVKRKLYLIDDRRRLSFEEFEDYRYRRAFFKMSIKEQLKGKMVHRSKNYEAKKFLSDTLQCEDVDKEKVNKAYLLSVTCNQGTYVKNKNDGEEK